MACGLIENQLMKTPLENILIKHFQEKGPLSVKQFIETALYHPDYGYYMGQQVFGQQGDYITAPEISQIFGELLAVKCLNYLSCLPTPPTSIALIEFGPGRGTLMADMLRTFKQFPTYYHHLKSYLIEVSPSLQQQQRKALADYPVSWVKNLEEVPPTEITFIIANEFFDALPIEQYLFINQNWEKRLVGLGKDEIDFLGPCDVPIRQEYPFYNVYMQDMNTRLKENKGMAIIIDYGEETPVDYRHGDTLQALHRHQYASLFERIGQQDLSHAVDFGELKRLTDSFFKIELTSQAKFLLSLGLEQRLEALCQKAVSEQQVLQLKTAAMRLIASSEMGKLFKVLTIESS